MADQLPQFSKSDSATARARIVLHPKQRIAFETLSTETGYGGSAGGGKSFVLRAILIYACSQIPNLRCYLFRKHFEELQQNHVDSTGGFREVLSDWIQADKVRILQDRIEFWNGSIIYLCHCSHASHLDKYLGPEMYEWQGRRIYTPVEIDREQLEAHIKGGRMRWIISAVVLAWLLALSIWMSGCTFVFSKHKIDPEFLSVG